MAEDKSLRISVGVHAELTKLADEYKQQIGSFADALLEYATANIDRVDEALAVRQQQGSKAARERRGEQSKPEIGES